MWPNPLPAAANSKPPAFPPWSWPPNQNLTVLKAAQKIGWPKVTPVPFLNPDPIVHLVGCSNNAPVLIDGQETIALIDSHAQVSSVSSQFYKALATGRSNPLGQLLEIGGDREILPSPTLGLWRSTSRSQGSNVIMRMCCCWLYQPWPILRWFQSWLAPRS